ncbi:hypothetical protein O1611_g8256 [Lasiodiplodia mahajangana]|uniref:Uncharacterized protein n=1 Tax=Lasiodiplodia mahajangana TaxID=1108764 RepID=A0ACC2JDU6_9PEZI|nr:hypothetical protein O1611_g8256 [Lasiodiplodia mahajangana]
MRHTTTHVPLQPAAKWRAVIALDIPPPGALAIRRLRAVVHASWRNLTDESGTSYSVSLTSGQPPVATEPADGTCEDFVVVVGVLEDDVVDIDASCDNVCVVGGLVIVDEAAVDMAIPVALVVPAPSELHGSKTTCTLRGLRHPGGPYTDTHAYGHDENKSDDPH